MSQQKQSVLLGLREKLEKSNQAMLDDMIQKFTNKQGLFQGERKTYVALEGFADDPTKRGFTHVSSTVKEQLDWFKKYTADYFKTVLSIERTNATGLFAELVIEGKSWGTFSTLELLRLKSIMDGKFRKMIDEIPIRSETEIWKKSEDPNFVGREVFENTKDESFSKTTLKERIIVSDPHIKDNPNRQPITDDISKQVNIGSYTHQKFSGALTNLERAVIKVKFDTIYKGIIEALEKANNNDVVESDLGDRFLEYMF